MLCCFSPRKAKNQSNPFFPRTPSRGASLAAAQQFTFCASEKTLLSPEVCERLSTRVRALGCIPSVGKAFWLCRQLDGPPVPPAARMISAWMEPTNDSHTDMGMAVSACAGWKKALKKAKNYGNT